MLAKNVKNPAKSLRPPGQSACHLHPKSPFKPEVDKKYEFNFEEAVKKVHQIDKYWTEDNEDQKLEKVKDRKKQTAKSESTPLARILHEKKVAKTFQAF
ncbi:hypothetical protein UZ36_03405, partial [Candidatus Nitromaritima sp. SCGC AAA799-C22]